MLVAIDIGNTYVKYKVSMQGNAGATKSLLTQDISSMVFELKTLSPSTIIVSNVSKLEVSDAIRAGLSGCDIRLVRSSSECLGVTNGYETPEKLGVDRWLAVIEAYHRSGKLPCAVFDLGTAITLDVIDSAGMHQGGYIVPGLAMMQEALQQATSQVRFSPRSNFTLEYGRNTADAVGNGAFGMVLAWMNNEIEKFTATYPGGCVYLTGGMARLAKGYLPQFVIHHEDLVLDALLRIGAN